MPLRVPRPATWWCASRENRVESVAFATLTQVGRVNLLARVSSSSPGPLPWTPTCKSLYANLYFLRRWQQPVGRPGGIPDPHREVGCTSPSVAVLGTWFSGGCRPQTVPRNPRASGPVLRRLDCSAILATWSSFFSQQRSSGSSSLCGSGHPNRQDRYQRRRLAIARVFLETRWVVFATAIPPVSTTGNPSPAVSFLVCSPPITTTPVAALCLGRIPGWLQCFREWSQVVLLCLVPRLAPTVRAGPDSPHLHSTYWTQRSLLPFFACIPTAFSAATTSCRSPRHHAQLGKPGDFQRKRLAVIKNF